MALDNKKITKVCKYWNEEESSVCSYWSSSSTSCTHGGTDGIYPTEYPTCNLIGTNLKCNLYNGKGVEPRCILPDVRRGGINRRTGTQWITKDENDSWVGFDDITCYGSWGFCDGDPDGLGNGYGSGDGLSIKCAGYNPSEMEFGSYFGDIPLDIQICNYRAIIGRCAWWNSEASMFLIDDSGKVVNSISMCVHTDAMVDKFKNTHFDEELGIFVLPCNGAVSDCPFYTGIKWEYCINKKLHSGSKVRAEQIQELRYYLRKNKWDAESFSNTFYNPDIYAWDRASGLIIKKVMSPSGVIEDNTVLNVIKVGFEDFSSFNLSFRNIEIDSGTKEEDIDVDYPTLIENLSLDGMLTPLILNVFDQKVGSSESDLTNIFEMVDIFDETILILGETRFFLSKPYVLNLSSIDIEGFPVELNQYSSMFEIRKNVSSTKYNEICEQIESRLNFYINYSKQDVGLNITPISVLNGGEFFIKVKTIIGNNTIIVFDKGGGSWDYDRVEVEKIYHGVVIAQTEFNVTSVEGVIEYPPYYPASFCGAENTNTSFNKKICFELKTFGDGKSEIEHVYNDYVIPNSYDGKTYEVGYIPYEVTLPSKILSYDDGNIIPLGIGGYLLLIIPDEDNLLQSIYKPWMIGDAETDEDIILKLEYSIEHEDDQSVAVAQQVADNKAFDLELFMRSEKYLPINQIIVKPKDVNTLHAVGPGCFIELKSIKIYEKKSFNEPSSGTKCDYIDSNDAVCGKDTVFCKDETKFELISNTVGQLSAINDETLLISVVFKSKKTGRILGVTRTKMITWVRNPSCRAAPIFYKWATEYEEFDMIPLQYYRFDHIGIIKRPASDSYIRLETIPGFGDFIMHPFVFSPTTALYNMDPDVLFLLNLPAEDFVIEYYRTEVLGSVDTKYEEGVWDSSSHTIQYFKSSSITASEEVVYTPQSVKHGYFDMCKLCTPKSTVTMWAIVAFGGVNTFCMANYLPANLVSLNPPMFTGATMYYAGIGIGYFEECAMNIPQGFIKSNQHTKEYSYGKFGGGTREVMDSYRSVDNVCYDSGEVNFSDYKDLIAFEGFKNGNMSLEEKIKGNLDIQDYLFRKWMPIYNTFSASDLNSNLVDYPFEEYTFDLKSPYYHPFSIYTAESIDGVSIAEKIVQNIPEEADIDAPIFKTYVFDDVFNACTFGNTFLGTMNPDGTYDGEVEGAEGLVYPNIAGAQANHPNTSWLSFKEKPTEGGEGSEGGGDGGSESIQWVWKERLYPVKRFFKVSSLKSNIEQDIIKKEDINNFLEPMLKGSYIEVAGKVTNFFEWLSIGASKCVFNYELREYNLYCETKESKLKILFLNNEQLKNEQPSMFFLQLNDGYPRGVSKHGTFDPEEMQNIDGTIAGFEIRKLYEFYTTCTKDPWEEYITLFDNGYVDIFMDDPEEDAIEDDRYYYDSNPATCNKSYFQRGINIDLLVFNACNLPSINTIIESYDISVSIAPDLEASNSAYTSITPNEWFPNFSYCPNIVYRESNSEIVDISFKCKEKVSISKIICKFKCKKEQEYKDSEFFKEIKVDYLYNVPEVQVKVNNSVVYQTEGIEFCVEATPLKDKIEYEGGEIIGSKQGAVEYNFETIEENQVKILDWEVNLLEDATYNDTITISFRMKPTSSELISAGLIDTLETFENSDTITYTEHCFYLECVYIYDTQLVDAYEDIEINNSKYFISTGNFGDFQPNKFDISNIERAFLKQGNGLNRISTLTQTDGFDGMVFYMGSANECTSIDKCRGRLMGKVQDIELKKEDSDGVLSTLEEYEGAQNNLYQDAIDKGETFFTMNSVCPPGLEVVLNDNCIEFPRWNCIFTNKMVLPLIPPLDMEPIQPDGYYFDWGLDKIIKRQCFRQDAGLVDCFDGYKLKSYTDQDKIVGVSLMGEIWTYAGSVQSRASSTVSKGWSANKNELGANDEFYKKLIILQNKHSSEQDTLRNGNERKILELNRDNKKALEDLHTEHVGSIKSLEGDEKIDMELEYEEEKYNLLKEQTTILIDTNIDQLNAWTVLISTQYREVEAENLFYVTRRKVVASHMSPNMYIIKMEYDTGQSVELLELEKTQKIDIITLTHDYDVKLIENERRKDYDDINSDEETAIENNRQSIEEEFNEEYDTLKDEQEESMENLINEQKESRESYYNSNGIEEEGPTETLEYLHQAMYGYGTQEENKQLMYGDVSSMDDISVTVSADNDDLVDYGLGTNFKVQREAYYYLLKEKGLTTEFFPPPIMAYYVK